MTMVQFDRVGKRTPEAKKRSAALTSSWPVASLPFLPGIAVPAKVRC